MKKVVKAFGLLSLLVLFNTANAQKKGFSPGYIVNNVNDTIRGNVEFDWPLKKGLIRLQTSGTPKSYEKGDVVAMFSEAQGLYIKREVLMDMSSNDAPLVLPQGEDKFENIEVFLQVVVLSNFSLYHYRDTNKGHYFVESPKTEGIQELIDERRYVVKDRLKNIIRSKKFQGQLAYYLGDCPDASGKVSKMPDLNQKKLRSAVKKYNECLNYKIDYIEEKKETKILFHAGVIGGVATTTLDLANDHRDRTFRDWVPGGLDFPSSTSFSGGLQLRLGTTRSKRFELILEGIYRAFETSINYEDDRVLLGEVDLDISYSQLQFNSLIEYKIKPKKTIYPFLQVGVSNSVINDFFSEKITQDVGINADIDIRDPFEGFDKSSEFGWIIGGGLSIQKLSLNIRYQKGNGIFNSIKGNSTETLFAQVSYTIF